MDTKNNSQAHTCDGNSCYGMHGSWGGHRIRGLVATLLVVLAVFVGVKALGEIKGLRFVGSGATPSATIQVTGTGEEVAMPDIAEFSFTIESEANTIKTAQDNVSMATDKALAFLKTKNIDEKDIHTTGYSIYPRYEYRTVSPTLCTQYGCPSGDTRVLAGYDVTQSFNVKVRTISDAGAVLGGLGDLGITNVGGITFSVDKKEELIAEARQKAIDDAREKAKVLAHDLGVDLVRVVSFQEGGTSSPMPIMYAAMDSAGGKSIPQVPSGDTTISSSVVIVYEIN